MPIFKDEGGILRKLKVSPVSKERELQQLVERNLVEVLDMRLIATEYATTLGGRIDTLAIDANGAPVIIEYKRGRNENVITQALSYLRWLKVQKVEFFEMLVSRACPDIMRDGFAIDWKNPRVLCVAESYSKFDVAAVEAINVRLELFRYRFYENGLFSLESMTGIDHLEETASTSVNSGKAPNPESIRMREPSSTLPVDPIGRAPQEMKDLFEELRGRILKLDEGITEKATNAYFGFRIQKNFAEVHIRKNKISVHLRAVNYNDPEQRVRAVPDTHGWTLSRIVLLNSAEDLDYVMRLVEQSYRDVL